MEDFRKELDELLGKDRNLPRSERLKKREYFDDNDICKYYLVAFCPHELFINTRNDIGRCKKRHDTFFKQQYLSDPNKIFYQKKYELTLLALLEQLVSSVDARIRRSLARIEAPMPDIEASMENRDKKNALNALIDRRMKEAEQLAEAGRVNESEQLIKEIEQLKEQKDDQDNMICEICGAMQSATDTERRTMSHLEGKQHKGFAAIRKCIEDLKSHKDMYRHVDLTKLPSKADLSKEQGLNRVWNNEGSSHGAGERERGEYRENRENRDGREEREYRETRDTREMRETREARETRDNRDNRDGRENKDGRENRDNRDNRDARDNRDNREPRDVRDNRDTRDTRTDRSDRLDRSQRDGKNERDRNERTEKEKNDRPPARNDRNERSERGDRGDRGNRSDRVDPRSRNERVPERDRSDRDRSDRDRIDRDRSDRGRTSDSRKRRSRSPYHNRYH